MYLILEWSRKYSVANDLGPQLHEVASAYEACPQDARDAGVDPAKALLMASGGRICSFSDLPFVSTERRIIIDPKKMDSTIRTLKLLFLRRGRRRDIEEVGEV